LSRASTILALVAAACSADAAPAPGAPTGAPENILLVVLDDVGVDSLGAFGEGRDAPPTPTIDALCAAGVRFENVWAPPLCMPARAAILTGRYGFRTGVGEIGQPGLPRGELTLAEMLDVGTGGRFATAAIGKWHVGGSVEMPRQQGFDRYAGALVNAGDYYRYRRTVDGERDEHEGYITTVEIDDALAWLDTAPEPWFCYLAFHAAHAPYQTPPPELYTITGRSRAREDDRFDYKATIEAMDRELGRLLAELGPEVLARTHLLVVGDDGTPQGVCAPPFPKAHGKGTMYEGSLNVPLVVTGPAVTGPGRVERALVEANDLFLTVAELARADLDAVRAAANGPLDSRSLVPYLAAPDAIPLRTTAYAEKFKPNGFGPWHSWVQAARDERYKLIRRNIGSRHADELFDLETDPFEQRDLLARDLPADVEGHRARLADILDDFAALAPASHPDPARRR
jgi:arylsulfatase A-like enzyme